MRIGARLDEFTLVWAWALGLGIKMKFDLIPAPSSSGSSGPCGRGGACGTSVASHHFTLCQFWANNVALSRTCVIRMTQPLRRWWSGRSLVNTTNKHTECMHAPPNIQGPGHGFQAHVMPYCLTTAGKAGHSSLCISCEGVHSFRLPPTSRIFRQTKKRGTLFKFQYAFVHVHGGQWPLTSFDFKASKGENKSRQNLKAWCLNSMLVEWERASEKPKAWCLNSMFGLPSNVGERYGAALPPEEPRPRSVKS